MALLVNMDKKPRYYVPYLLLGFGLAIILALIIFLFASSGDSKVHLPTAALALEHVDLSQTKPVTEEILAFNHLRKKAGLIEVKKDWRIAAHDLIIMDGPIVTVLLDEKGVPAKVILTEQIYVPRKYDRTREYDVLDRKLCGRAVTWRGMPPALFKVETYRKNKLNGVTTYYSKTGEQICGCEFRNGRPWTGRKLERDDFDRLMWDVSYKEGKKHGEEKCFLEGKLDRLGTFKKGIPHGLQQQYHKGQLRSEEIVENGIRRSHKSWHQNGQLNGKEYYSAKGKLDGVRRMWNEDGVLELEENYRNGKRHGRFWYKEFPNSEGWYWNGRGAGGKEGFERRQSGKRRMNLVNFSSVKKDNEPFAYLWIA